MTIHVPYLFGRGAVTLHPRLVLVSSRARRRRSAAEYAVLLAHEDVHRGQMVQDGWLRFGWRYLFTGEWRARYEMEAFRVDLAYYASRGVAQDTAAAAIVEMVRRSYFPRMWFGRPPAAESMLVWLREDSARKEA